MARSSNRIRISPMDRDEPRPGTSSDHLRPLDSEDTLDRQRIIHLSDSDSENEDVVEIPIIHTPEHTLKNKETMDRQRRIFIIDSDSIYENEVQVPIISFPNIPSQEHVPDKIEQRPVSVRADWKSTRVKKESKEKLNEFCTTMIDNEQITKDDILKAYGHILNNDDNLIVEICHNYSIRFDTNEGMMKDIKTYKEAITLQKTLLHLLIGHYFDIFEGQEQGQQPSDDTLLRNFFIWSLFAPQTDVVVKPKAHKCCHKCTLTPPSKDTPKTPASDENHKCCHKCTLTPPSKDTPKTSASDQNHECCHKCTLTPPSKDKPTNLSVQESGEDMAMLIFDRLDDKIFSALFAAALLKELSRKSVDEKESLRDFSSKFSQKAIDLIKEKYKDNEKDARRLLKEKKEMWGNMSILKLAVYSKNLDFLQEPVCKTLLQEEWMGHLSSTMSVKMIGFCLFCLFVGPIFGATFKQPAMDSETREKKDWWKNLTYWTKTCYFFEAPVVRFLIHGITYIVFLGYLSYVLLIQFRSEWTNDDYILIAFMSIIFAEELLQFLKELSGIYRRVLRRKLTTWLLTARGLWFIITVVSSILFYVGYVIKSNSIEAARIVLGFDLILLYFRSLHIFSIHKTLGPKIVMIGHMFKDLCYFVVILLVFVVSYGMAAHSIMYPNSELNIEFVLNLLKRAYWNLYGELLIEELEQKEPSCTFDESLYSNDTLPRCPTYISTVWIPIMMGFYILVSNILLLNLLIAMFNSTFNKIEVNSSRLWNYQRYFLIRQYKTRFWTPIALLYAIFRCFKYCCGKRKNMSQVNPAGDPSVKNNKEKHETAIKSGTKTKRRVPEQDKKLPGHSDNQNIGSGNSSNDQESHA